VDLNTTLDQIKALSVEDRVWLVGAIWDSIDEDAEQLPLTDAQRQEFERCLADDVANPDDVTSWDEVKAELLARARL
jgi:putative addiction module component (TIGR02574 family)